MNRHPDDPLQTLTTRLFGVVLTCTMNAAQIAPGRVARTARLDVSYVYKIRRGEQLPSLEATGQLDNALGADGLLIQAHRLLKQISDTDCGMPEPRSGALFVGDWRIDVDEHGRLVAEKDGTSTVLAGEGLQRRC